MKPTSAAIWNRMYFDEVVVELAAVLDRPHDGGEVVVGQDHHRGVLRHLGAGDAHGHADVGLLERRRVVHAVAGHGDDVALLLRACDQADLVLRRHAGHDADLGELGGQLLVGQGGELGAGERLAGDAELLADGGGRDRVVAGDHAHLDAGAVALARWPPSPRPGAGRRCRPSPCSVRSWTSSRCRSRPGRTWPGSKSRRATTITRSPDAAMRSFSVERQRLAVVVDRRGRRRRASRTSSARSMSTSGAPLTKQRTTSRPSRSVIRWNVAMNL